MVKVKGEENVYWLDRVLDDVEMRNPVIETRWYVVEVTPRHRYSYGNGHGGVEYDWSDEVETKVSPYFRTKKSAAKWMDEHEADPGKSLAIMKQNKRRTITEKWWSPTRIRV
jgi:hypothetical protein